MLQCVINVTDSLKH